MPRFVALEQSPARHAGWPGRMADGRRGGTGRQVQAEIAACHVQDASVDRTDWERIAALYVVLGHLTPSQVIELNRACRPSAWRTAPRAARPRGPPDRKRPSRRTVTCPRSAATCWPGFGRLNEAREEFEQTTSLTSDQREQALFQHAPRLAARPA